MAQGSSVQLKVLDLLTTIPALSSLTAETFLPLPFATVERILPVLLSDERGAPLLPRHSRFLTRDPGAALSSIVAKRVADRRDEVSRLPLDARSERESAYRRAFMQIACLGTLHVEQALATDRRGVEIAPVTDYRCRESEIGLLGQKKHSRETDKAHAARVASWLLSSSTGMHAFIKGIILLRAPRVESALSIPSPIKESAGPSTYGGGKEEEKEGDEEGAVASAWLPVAKDKVDAEVRMVRAEYDALRRDYEALLEETPHETLDGRRVSFLKAQVLQLERQVVSLSLAVEKHELAFASQSESMTRALYQIEDVLAEHRARGGSEPTVAVPIQTLRAVAGELSRSSSKHAQVGHAHAEEADKTYAIPLRTINPFIRPWKAPPFSSSSTQEPESRARSRLRARAVAEPSVINQGVSIVSLAKGAVAMNAAAASVKAPLHLGHLASLETDLSELYATAVGARAALETVLPMVTLPGTQNQVLDTLGKLQAQVKQVSSALLSLGMVVPMAVSSRTRISANRPMVPPLEDPMEVPSARELLKALPPFARDKKAGAHLIAATLSGLRYRDAVRQAEIRALEEVLAFQARVSETRTSHALQVVINAENIASGQGRAAGDRLLNELDRVQEEAFARYSAAEASYVSVRSDAASFFEAKFPQLWQALQGGGGSGGGGGGSGGGGGGRVEEGGDDDDDVVSVASTASGVSRDSLTFSPITPGPGQGQGPPGERLGVAELLAYVLEEERV